MSVNRLENVDPFDSVDAEPEPSAEEDILITRMESEYYPKVLDWFFSHLDLPTERGSVLEIGCGTGQVLDLFVRQLGVDRVTRAVGIDLSEYLVNRASKRFPQYEIGVGDGSALSLPDGEIDLAFTATVLVHAADPAGIVSEIYRVLRPGGVGAILDQDFGSAVLHPGEKELTRRVLTAATDFWQEGRIGRKLPSLMRKAGFEAVRVDAHARVDRTLDVPFFTRIRDWIVRGGFPSADAERWLDELVKGAANDEFLFTRNFYACVGRRPE